jgi:hypothetical protein
VTGAGQSTGGSERRSVSSTCVSHNNAEQHGGLTPRRSLNRGFAQSGEHSSTTAASVVKMVLIRKLSFIANLESDI